MTIKDYLRIVRQRWLVVLVIVFLSTSIALIMTLRQAPIYKAGSRLWLAPTAGTGTDATALAAQRGIYKGLNTEIELVRSQEVAKLVIEELNRARPGELPVGISIGDLLAKVEVTVTPGYSDVVYVITTDTDPQRAMDLANAFPRAYIKVRRADAIKNANDGAQDISKRIVGLLAQVHTIEQKGATLVPGSTEYELLKGQRDNLIAEIGQMENTRSALLDTSIFQKGSIGSVIQDANLPAPSTQSDPVRTAVLGFIIGLPLALGIVLLLDALSDTVRSKEDAEKIVSADMLGLIPMSPDWRSSNPYIVTKEAPYSAAAEAYRTLRINLNPLAAQGEGRQILFTSPGMGEGKTLSCANVAVAFAESGRSVLLVSADLRRPRLHRLFDIEAGPGLTELLQGERSQDLIKETSPNLYVLPSGSVEERPDQLLNRHDLKEVLDGVILPRKSQSNPGARNGSDSEVPRGGDGPLGVKSPASQQAGVGVSPDVILLDAPSVLGAAEVSAMAAKADGVVLVLHAGITRRQAALRAAEQIRRAGGKIAGFVLVGVRDEKDYSVYPPNDTDSSNGNGSDSPWSRVVGALRS